ncbi:MAG: M20/M25/M40 family metallo-hydrolase, partial [Planctomycetota bacterium]
MITAAQRRPHLQWLLQLTGLPTAAGREDRVVQWVRDWVAARRNLQLRRDRAGNMLIRRAGRTSRRAPIFVTAHLDHPAFVVRSATPGRPVDLEFRGGVLEPYFEDARIRIEDGSGKAHNARIVHLDADAKPYKRVRAELSRPTDALRAGDIGRWAFRGRGATPTVHRGLMHAPACDDLAGVAVALSALDVLRRRKGTDHVGLLLTVAEEVGFLGAIAACKLRTVPRSSRLICLENSRSFPDSP